MTVGAILAIIIPTIFLITQIVGVLKQIQGPLTWVGRTIMKLILKHMRIWPIQIKRVNNEYPRAFLRADVGVSIEPNPQMTDLYISCSARLKNWDKKSEEKIRRVTIELAINGQHYIGSEASRSGDDTSLSDYITGIPVRLIENRLYNLVFSVSAITYPYLKGWYTNKCLPIANASVGFMINGSSSCSYILGEVKRDGQT